MDTIDTLLAISGVYGGGGKKAVLTPKSVTQNGNYNPADDGADGYSGVSVNVPNTYAAGDEGKVVSNGELVNQTSTTITQNSIVDTTTIGQVTVNVEGGGPVIVPENDVTFYDYDGTIIASYTKSQFASLTELPANPTHTGLTAQGWNWSLSDAKTYVADYGKLDIGQMYITDDGKTRIYIHLREGRLEPTLGLAVNGTAVVDWGDGSGTTAMTGTSVSTVVTASHTYAAPGDYVIAVQATGTMAIMGNASTNSQLISAPEIYRRGVSRVEIGGNCSLGNYAFAYLRDITSVTLPSGITKLGGTTFYNCGKLRSATVPDTVTRADSGTFVGTGCRMISVPAAFTSMGDQCFNNSYSLGAISLPNVTRLGGSVLAGCSSLSVVTVPRTVTSIMYTAFQSCSGLARLRFTAQTPPTVSNSNAFSYIPADCVIEVPAGTLTAYTTATNYPDPNTYTYVEY